MASCGVPLREIGHAVSAVRCGIDMLKIAGVIGKNKFCYDLWDDTVNIASRMESHREPGRVPISESTYHLIKDEFNTEKAVKWSSEYAT